METKKVRKDGRYYLLRKIEKLQAEIVQLKSDNIRKEAECLKEQHLANARQKTIDRLCESVQALTLENVKIEEREKRELIAHESLVSELCEHMGAFRRWLWRLKHGS